MVPCSQAHAFPFHRNATSYLGRMGGEVYVEGRTQPVKGKVPLDRYIALIQKRDAHGRAESHPNHLSVP